MAPVSSPWAGRGRSVNGGAVQVAIEETRQQHADVSRPQNVNVDGPGADPDGR